MHSKKAAPTMNLMIKYFICQVIIQSVWLVIIFILRCLHWLFSDSALCFRAETTPVIGGFLLLKQLQPSCYQYREGREYCVLHHIQSGSYGDVFCVQDKRTGFQCAAKKVRMPHICHRLYIFYRRFKTQDFSLCCRLISGPTESLQQRGGEHMERSRLCPSGRALRSSEGGA